MAGGLWAVDDPLEDPQAIIDEVTEETKETEGASQEAPNEPQSTK